MGETIQAIEDYEDINNPMELLEALISTWKINK